jgi:hypothetical protein
MTNNLDSKSQIKSYYKEVVVNSTPILFENLPELIEPQLASIFLKKSVATLYDWNYRGKTRKSKIPPDLFTKLGGSLRIRKDILGDWMSNRCSSH